MANAIETFMANLARANAEAEAKRAEIERARIAAAASAEEFKPGETRWQNFARRLWDPSGGADDTARKANLAIQNKGLADMTGVSWLNSSPVPAKPGDSTAATVPKLVFDVQGPAAPGGAQLNPILAQIPAQFGGTMTSGVRTPEKNAKVGGVGNSYHLTGQGADYVPPPGTPMAVFAQNLRKSMPGWDVINEGDHVHVEPGPNMATPVSTGNPFVAPPVAFMDPGAARGMISAPTMLPQINLPDAPQQELPAARPDLAKIDPTLIDKMFGGLDPVESDRSMDKWNGVKAMLEGAAGRAAGADPGAGLGQFLLLAGGGALEGDRVNREKTKAEIKRESEAQRQFDLLMADKKYGVLLENLGIDNTNADRQWQSGEDTRKVKFDNASGTFETNVREAMANAGITGQNVGAINSAKARGDSAALGAAGGAIDATNQANANQSTLDRAAYTDVSGGGGQDRRIQQLLMGAGVPLREEGKPNPVIANARTTASYIAANNIDGALGGLATEMLLSGKYADLLKPEKGENAQSAAAKAELKKAIEKASNGGKSIDAASAVLATFFSQNPGIGMAAAKAYQTLPSAKMIATHGKVQ